MGEIGDSIDQHSVAKMIYAMSLFLFEVGKGIWQTSRTRLLHHALAEPKWHGGGEAMNFPVFFPRGREFLA
jgi:hypothetical protein